jgi:hypothetical protein
MVETLSRLLNALSIRRDVNVYRLVLAPTVDLQSCQSFISATIVPSVGAVTAKVGAVDWYGIASGVLVKVAATTVLPALVGTIAQNTFNVYAYYVDSAGVVTSQMGVAGTTLAGVKWPTRPTGKAYLGASLFNPTAASFIGGTTLADAANTNHVGLNALGGFDQTSLV